MVVWSGEARLPSSLLRKEEESNPCHSRGPPFSRRLPGHPGFTFLEFAGRDSNPRCPRAAALPAAGIAAIRPAIDIGRIQL